MKTIAFVILLLTSFMVSAEWIKFSENDEHVTFHYDPKTITQTPINTVRLWVLLVSPSKVVLTDASFQSAKAYYEVDCTDDTMRTLRMVFYSGIASGSVVKIDNNVTSYIHYAPDTPASIIINLMCGKVIK